MTFHYVAHIFDIYKSSGPGGQNVNKVNTQVVVRFHIMNASWIPLEVRERIKLNEHHRINNDGVMMLASQQYRTQVQNKKDVLNKLENIILENYARPKIRKMKSGPSNKSKERNKVDKSRRSQLKANRKNITDY